MRCLTLFTVFVLPAVCVSATILSTLDAPDTNISGLAWGGGKLWALDSGSEYIYGLNPATGNVDVSFQVNHIYGPDSLLTGLAYSNGFLFAASNVDNNTLVYAHSETGAYEGFDAIC